MAADAENKIEIKKYNRQRIFQMLYRGGVQSRQELSYALHMSWPTVTQNVQALLEQGLIQEAGELESTGGRKAQGLAVDPTARYSIGLDITRHHVCVLILDFKGGVAARTREVFPFVNDAAYFAALGGKIEDAVRAAGIPRQKVLGVGIGVPAILSQDRESLQYSPVLEASGVTRGSFAAGIPYPCMLHNDAKAAGMAELWSSNDHGNMVYLSLGNSVGGAIILHNRLGHGQNQRSAEFGHITIVPDGKPCYCGQHGCLDAYCNARVLAERENGDLSRFFAKLEQGDPASAAVWEEYLNYLAIAVNNLRLAFDCNIVIGGYVGSYLEPSIQRLREKVAARSTFHESGNYLRACRHKLESIAYGAALGYLEPFLKAI